MTVGEFAGEREQEERKEFQGLIFGYPTVRKQKKEMNTSNHRSGWKDTTVQTLEIWEGEKKFKEKLKGQMGCEVLKGNEK